MERGGEILGLTAGDVMTRHPCRCRRDTLAVEALNIMEQRRITSIVVVEDGLPDRSPASCTARSVGATEMF